MSVREFNLIFYLILAVIGSSSCVVGDQGAKKKSEEGKESTSNSRQSNDSTTNNELKNDSPGDIGSSNTGIKTSIKSFNQINMTYSKLTNISRGDPEVSEIMEKVLNQLPADNQLTSFSPFHQISITRLSFKYCDLFFERDSVFKNLNYGSLNSKDIVDRMIERFLDSPPEEDPNVYEVLREEMMSVIDNDTVDGVGKLVEESNKVAEDRRKLTKMACSLLLSSPFLILI